MLIFFDKTAIADIVHDRFLDVTTIHWDEINNTITMSYFEDCCGDVCVGKITIQHVIDLIFQDTEKIQYYDLNYINWVSDANKIAMITNEPLLLEILVSEFEMTIEIY